MKHPRRHLNLALVLIAFAALLAPAVASASMRVTGVDTSQYPTLRATRLYDMIRDRGYTGSVRRLREVIVELQLRPRPQALVRPNPKT